MKTKVLYQFIIFVTIFLTTVNLVAEAQRRTVVVKKPSRTVVVTRISRSHLVYVNRRVVTPPVVVRTLPATAVTIVQGRTRYYYDAGCYYTMRPDGYLLVNPPVGIVVASLPPSFVRVVVRSSVFFYVGGVFYREIPERGYKTVDPPAGAHVESLPEDAEKVTVEGAIFYEHKGTLYKKVETETGFAYEVSGNVES